MKRRGGDIFASQLMLSKIKRGKRKKTGSVSASKRAFAVCHQCLESVCLPHPWHRLFLAQDTRAVVWKLEGGCACSNQLQMEEKYTCSAYRQWLYGKWTFFFLFLGEVGKLSSWTCSRRKLMKYNKQRITWSQQWKARIYRITTFVFCKMNLVKQSHLSFPSPTLKGDSRFVVKGNSFSAWANTEMATVYEMPCRQVILQGGLIHQGCTRGSGPFRQCYWYFSGCNIDLLAFLPISL